MVKNSVKKKKVTSTKAKSNTSSKKKKSSEVYDEDDMIIIPTKKNSAYSKEKQLAIINKLAKANGVTKETIMNNNKHGMNSFQPDLNKLCGRNTNDVILHYEIDPKDNILIQNVIRMINDREINSKWIYDRMYKLFPKKCPTYEKARMTGYNYLYALTVKKELGIDRLEQWLKILGVSKFDVIWELGEIDEDEESIESLDEEE